MKTTTPGEDRLPRPRVTAWTRVILVGMTLALSGYVAALFRTTAVGFDLRHLCLEAFFATSLGAPFAAAAFLGSGWSWPRGIVGVLLACGLGVLAAEIWAGVEEYRFVQRHRHVASGPCPRQFFTDAWLSYDPAVGRLQGGD